MTARYGWTLWICLILGAIYLFSFLTSLERWWDLLIAALWFVVAFAQYRRGRSISNGAHAED